MTKAGPRGPLKQVRLGVVQKKVLIVLLGIEMQHKRVNGFFAGMPHKELHARLYNQAFIGEGQWLQTVHAQLLLEKDEVQAANQILIDGIDLIITLVKNDSRDGLLNSDVTTQLLLTGVLDEVSRIENTASLLRHTQGEFEPAALHTTLLSLTREMAGFVTHGLLAQRGAEAFLTLNDDEKAAALKAVNVQHASLSRALRGLLTHGLIEQRETLLNHFYDHERRYFISRAGVERFYQEAQKAATGTKHMLFSR